jgi:thioredoxin 1
MLSAEHAQMNAAQIFLFLKSSIMYRFKVYFSILMMMCFTVTLIANEVKINFTSININDARKIASQEGKLIFIDFHADWCTPCKWMEQTTFKDEKVVTTLNSNFVSVKANIDETDGFELKNAYDIKYLPTMLIFNSQGQLLDRVEETLSPRKLLTLLEKYNAPEHKQVTKHDFNSSPALVKHQNDIKESESMAQSASEFKKYFNEKQTSNAYRVQVGVFERYEGAADMVQTLKQLFVEQVTVTNEYKDGVPVFKVRIGQFETLQEAENFKNIIKNDYNMNGLVL